MVRMDRRLEVYNQCRTNTVVATKTVALGKICASQLKDRRLLKVLKNFTLQISNLFHRKLRNNCHDPALFSSKCTINLLVAWLRLDPFLRTGARELSESCVSQNSGGLETEQPCVLAQGGGSGGGSGVSPPRNFCNSATLQICILSHFLAKMTCKTTRSRGHASGQSFLLSLSCMMYGVVLTNHNILDLNRISDVHLIIVVLARDRV